MSMPTRQKFMQVKEKLDFYKLPTSFPPETTNLISKLLQKIQQKSNIQTDPTKDSHSPTHLSPYISPQTSPRINSLSQQSISKQESTLILQLKIKQLLKQNNFLHKQLMDSKQYIQILRQSKQLQRRVDCSQKGVNLPLSGGQNNQINILRNGFQILKARQIQLCQQLTQAKFKYNQLMDFLHEDPNLQRRYIKRLFKHKRMDFNSDGVQNNQLIQNHYKSETSYGVTKSISNSLNIELSRIHVQNNKLTCLNNNLKLKVQNRQLQILRLQRRISDEFNLDGLALVYKIEQKDTQLSNLKNQIQLLLQKTDTIQISSSNKNLQKVSDRVTIKSPSINIIKSPSKNADKTVIKTVNDNKGRMNSKQKTINKPKLQISQLETLRKQNTELKSQIQSLKKQFQVEKVKLQDSFKNKILKNTYETQRTEQKSQNKRSVYSSKKTQKNRVEQNLIHQDKQKMQNALKLIEDLKGQLLLKDGQIKKIQLRWKDSQQENRVLIEELSEKRRYVQKLLSKNISAQQELNKHDKAKANNNSYNSNRQKQLQKKSPSNLQLKKTNLKTTNLYTTNNNLLSTNLQNTAKGGETEQDKFSKKTPIYSPSQYEKSQKNTFMGNKVYSEKIEIDLKSQNDSNQGFNYPSNIHSKISSQKQSKKSQGLRLQDIQEEDSLEKSHHSEEQRKSKVNQSRQKNNGGIRISITNNNKEAQQSFYENKMLSQKSGDADCQSRKISSLENHKNVNFTQNKTQQNNELLKEDSHLKDHHGQQLQDPTQPNNVNLLEVQDSDKASMFSMRKQIDQLKIEHRKQTKTKKKLQIQLKESEQEKQKLQDMMFELQAKIQELQDRKNKAKLQFKEDAISQSSNTVQVDRKLRYRIKEQQQRINELEEQNIQTQIRVRDRDSRIKNFEQKIESLSSKIDELTEKIKALDLENHELRKERQKLLVLQNYGKKQQPQQKQQTQNPTYANGMEQSNQILWLKKQISTLQSRISKYNQTINQLNDYIGMHRQQKQKLSMQKLNVVKENQYLKKKLQELQRALSIQAEQMKRYRETFDV